MRKLYGWFRVAFIAMKARGFYSNLTTRQRRRIAATISAYSDKATSPELSRASVLHVCGHIDEAMALLDRVIATGDPVLSAHAHIELAEILASDGNIAGARQAVDRAIADGLLSQRPVTQACGGLLLLRHGDTSGEALSYQAFEALLDQLPLNATWLCALTARLTDHLRAHGRTAEAAALLARVEAKDPSLFEPSSPFYPFLSRDAAA